MSVLVLSLLQHTFLVVAIFRGHIMLTYPGFCGVGFVLKTYPVLQTSIVSNRILSLVASSLDWG